MILSRNKYSSPDPAILIDKKIKSGKLSSLLVIVPTNRKSRALKREFIGASNGKVAGKINIDTIGTFAKKIHSALNPIPLTILSEAASAVLLKRSFNSARLNYFNRYKAEVPSGTLKRIQNILSEYKRHGITPSKLFSEAENLEGSEKLKACDIASIYELYNEECKKSNSGETGDIYKNILSLSGSLFNNAFEQVFPGVDLVIINGFDEFTSPEVDLLSGIPGEVLISFDYYQENPGIFLHLEECYERFIAKGFHIIGQTSHNNENDFYCIIRKNYFNNDSPVKKFDFNITELTALNREREVEIIAKEIKELLKDNKLSPDKICVVFNLIQNYSPLVRDIFNLYGIPYNLTDRIPLSAAGPVTALISFLEIPETGFFYKNIFRALSSGFISIKNVSISDLIRSAADLNIISGYDNWILLLNERITIEEQFKKIIYTRAVQSIEKLNDILAPLERKQSIPEFKKNLFNLIDNLHIPENILSFSGESEQHFKALFGFYDVLDELFSLLIAEYGEEKEFHLSFFLKEIRTAAENSRFNVSEKPGYGVQVTNLNEIRGLSFQYLFIGGLIDGELPTRYTPEVFYSGSFAREEWKHQVEERYHFYQSLCTWQKGLYLSHPLQDDNKELNPSIFLSELKNLFNIKLINEQNYSDTLYSLEELQEYTGTNIHNPDFINVSDEIDPEQIRKTIRIYNERKSGDNNSPYNGYILESLPEELQDKINKLSEKEFSVTQLEAYAGCPFKYFMERVLYLNVPDEPAEDMEPLELGKMLHKILYRFYKQITGKKIELYQCSDEDFASAEKVIFSIAEEVLNENPKRSPLNFFEIERLTGINGVKRNSILFKFLTEERERGNGYLPYNFEVPFGSIQNEEGELKANSEFTIENIRLRGKIDRIDINPVLSRIRITDYKLNGKKPEVNELERGLSLQLPLYLLAAKQLVFKDFKKDFEPAAADIYSLKYQDGKFGRKPIVSEGRRTESEVLEEYDRIILICIESIKKYVQNISLGIFNTSELEDKEKKSCRYCNFKLICRIDE